MKALTLWQPWASLIALGEKKIETRSWKTDYRGPLAIHAASKSPESAYRIAVEEPYKSALERDKPDDGWHLFLPFGRVICKVQLIDILCVEDIRATLRVNELAFGDYSNGRWAWILELQEAYIPGFKAKGHQRLWEWEPTLGEQNEQR